MLYKPQRTILFVLDNMPKKLLEDILDAIWEEFLGSAFNPEYDHDN